MSYIKSVCNILGIELNVPFQLNEKPDIKFIVTEDGGLRSFYQESGIGLMQNDLWWKILSNELTIRWQPSYKDVYYYISPTNEEVVRESLWANTSFDIRMLERGLLFKTYDSAMRKAKSLGWIVEDNENEGC